ncbi:MAG: zinc-dependent alcohol dehydrogenase family protein [Actinobacteria bacterium]|nr:zinc-dependent alcohol dehydrogenase family protein [Actinomycetota bacterium]
MNALLLSAINQIAIAEQPTPKPEPGRSVIKVLASGLCGTDRHIYKGEYPSNKPVILGHEFGGVINSPSPDCKYSAGDLVSVDPNIVCGKCIDCLAGRTAFCPSLIALGVNMNGGFAQYALVPDTQLHKVSNALNPLHLAFIEPTACCIRGLDIAAMQGGEKVAVLGGGVMGQIVAQLSALANASQITMVTRQRARRELAISLGATDSVDPVEKEVESKLQNYDVVFECAGVVETFNLAQKIARRGGSIVVLGLTPEKTMVDFNPFQLVIKELRIQGSFLNPLTQRRAADLVDSGKLRLDPLISRTLSLLEVPEILNKPPGQSDVKYVVVP